MSRIYFHSTDSIAEVSGRERALMGNYCSEAFMLALGPMQYCVEEPWIMQHIPPGCYLHRGDSILPAVRDIETWLRVAYGENAGLILDGVQHPLFLLQLDSAYVMGSNSMKLAARLHGQCEVHCYVEGPNRRWLSDMIDEAVDKHIFREGEGWDDVSELLCEADDSPVVCSYSVCESFPNQEMAGWEGDSDSWYDLPAQERWDRAMASLRGKDSGLELKPDDWDSFTFGDSGVSGFDFRNNKPSA